MIDIVRLSSDAQKAYTGISASGKTRSLLLTVIIAKILADREPLPSGPLEDIRDYYQKTLVFSVKKHLGLLNEILTLDLPAIEEYAYKFYCLRYALICPPSAPFCMDPRTLVEDFFGISNFIGANVIEALRENPLLTTDLFKKTAFIVAELAQDPTSTDAETTGA
jgi:hypothetical protein